VDVRVINFGLSFLGVFAWSVRLYFKIKYKYFAGFVFEIYFLTCISNFKYIYATILYLNTLKRIVPSTAIKQLVADPPVKE